MASASAPRSPLIVMRDTRAWTVQTWVSFGIAVFLCATGLAYLPGEALDRAFMVMGYVLCLSTVFVLSKVVRDSQQATTAGAGETPMWRLAVWGGFAVAMGLRDRHEADLSDAQLRDELIGRRHAQREGMPTVAGE